MIVIFIYRSYKNWIDVLHYFKQYYSDCVILTRYNKYYFEKADVIIPVTVSCEKKLSMYKEFKHKFLISNKKTYDILDDKVNFYNFINEHKLLYNSNIKLINTYDKHYNGPDNFGKYMVKHRYGTGSSKNYIIKGNIKKIIKKYSDNNQIQDLLDIDHINCISCLCKNGNLIDSINFVVPHFISKKLYNTNHTLTLKHPDKNLIELISAIIRITNYSGFVEFEFLVDKNNSIYVIECNPRISGTIRCMLNKNDIPYIYALVNPYINIITKFNLDVRHYNDMTKLKYNGKPKYPYHVSSDGLIHFHKKQLKNKN